MHAKSDDDLIGSLLVHYKIHFEKGDFATFRYRPWSIKMFITLLLISVDTIPPVISNCDDGLDLTQGNPGNAMYETHENGSITYYWSYPQAEDEYSETLNITTATREEGDTLFYPGRNKVTIGFQDEAGNTAICTFEVIVSKLH